MLHLLRFNARYFLLFLLLFATELLIALYVRDSIIRPYGGDVLVVIMVYSLLMAMLKLPWRQTAVGVLIFAFVVELSQFFNLIRHLDLQGERWAQWTLGSSFHWIDLVAYSLGFLIILGAETLVRRKWRVPQGTPTP